MMPTWKKVKRNDDLEVLYEDEEHGVLIVNKPPDVPMLTNEETIGMDSIVNEYFKLRYKNGSEEITGTNCHRLDMPTSGVVCFAMTRKGRNMINTQFSEHQVLKCYLAVVSGHIECQGFFLMDETIRADPSCPRKFRQQAITSDNDLQGNQDGGRPSVTYGVVLSHGRLIKTKENVTKVLLIPKTGRTHQLRVHLANAGFPIIGDQTYNGGNVASEQCERLLLHAWKLRLKLNGDWTTIESKDPFDEGRYHVSDTNSTAQDTDKALSHAWFDLPLNRPYDFAGVLLYRKSQDGNDIEVLTFRERNLREDGKNAKGISLSVSFGGRVGGDADVAYTAAQQLLKRTNWMLDPTKAAPQSSKPFSKSLRKYLVSNFARHLRRFAEPIRIEMKVVFVVFLFPLEQANGVDEEILGDAVSASEDSCKALAKKRSMPPISWLHSNQLSSTQSVSLVLNRLVQSEKYKQQLDDIAKNKVNKYTTRGLHQLTDAN